MALSESKRRANDKYIQSHYERLSLGYPKGTRDRWKQAASARGLSLAEFIRQAVEKLIVEGVKK